PLDMLLVFVYSRCFCSTSVSVVLFNCAHIILISSFTVACCFCDDTCPARFLSAFRIPTHCTTQFPRFLWLNAELLSSCVCRIRASNIPPVGPMSCGNGRDSEPYCKRSLLFDNLCSISDILLKNILSPL
uniref:Secreted protein n=1 Tax=Parascaris univalens TaxID=6257 RepID=A0A915BRS1_PARUN